MRTGAIPRSISENKNNLVVINGVILLQMKMVWQGHCKRMLTEMFFNEINYENAFCIVLNACLFTSVFQYDT